MKLKYINKELFSNDRKVLEKKYAKAFGYKPDLDNPERFTEITNWQKLYKRDPLMTKCADKVLVRKYVAEKIGSEYLIPLLATGRSWDDINYDGLQAPFIIKTNHGSGDNKFVFDKNDASEVEMREQFTKLLKQNYYYGLREWQYKHIKPQILVEKLLFDENGHIPVDFKFHCFNYGDEIELIVGITVDRLGETKAVYYDESWNKLDLQWGVSNAGVSYPKPENWAEISLIAKKLAKDFNYVRVDLYNVLGKIYFGELTFSHYSGLTKLVPDKWDFILGEKFIKTGILKLET